jgi:hypothetical protein
MTAGPSHALARVRADVAGLRTDPRSRCGVARADDEPLDERDEL